MKKLLCIALILTLILSVFSVPVFAEDSEQQENVLHFDTNTAKWRHKVKADKVYCYIYGDNGNLNPWDDREKARCYDYDGDGVFTYYLDEQGITLEDNKEYVCIFSCNGYHTNPLLFDSSVLGDTAFTMNEPYLGGEDVSPKHHIYAYWKNQDPKIFGPPLETTLYCFIGTAIGKQKTPQQFFEEYFHKDLYLGELSWCTNKTEQTLVDGLANKLGLSLSQVEESLSKTGIEIDWCAQDSVAGMCVGDVDGDSQLTVLDASMIQLHVAQLKDFTDMQEKLADKNYNTEVSVMDATYIQLDLAGYLTKYIV